LSAVPTSSIGLASRTARGPVRWLVVAAVLLSLVALAIGFGTGAVPGRDWTIVFIHVPAAWLSLALYGAAVASAAVTLQAPQGLQSQPLAAIAPVGAAVAFLALWTGLTSQQAHGAGWGWDARPVCELVLLLLFCGAIALRSAVHEPLRAERASSVLVLVGALNVPIIYLSVDWWHSLHERAAATVARSPLGIAAMAVMTLAFCMYAGAVVLARLETLARERSGGTRNFATASAEGGSARTPAKE
jgi:heme exporter protein C